MKDKGPKCGVPRATRFYPERIRDHEFNANADAAEKLHVAGHSRSPEPDDARGPSLAFDRNQIVSWLQWLRWYSRSQAECCVVFDAAILVVPKDVVPFFPMSVCDKLLDVALVFSATDHISQQYCIVQTTLFLQACFFIKRYLLGFTDVGRAET